MSQERKLTVDTVECKNIRLKSAKGSLLVSARSQGFHAFLSKSGAGADDPSIALICNEGGPYIQVYPEGGARRSMPFAITTMGIQIPNPGEPTEAKLVPFRELFRIAKLFESIDAESVLRAFGKTEEA